MALASARHCAPVPTKRILRAQTNLGLCSGLMLEPTSRHVRCEGNQVRLEHHIEKNGCSSLCLGPRRSPSTPNSSGLHHLPTLGIFGVKIWLVDLFDLKSIPKSLLCLKSAWQTVIKASKSIWIVSSFRNSGPHGFNTRDRRFRSVALFRGPQLSS